MILIKFDCVNYCIGSKRAETTRNLDAISWLVSFDLISNPYIQLTLVMVFTLYLILKIFLLECFLYQTFGLEMRFFFISTFYNKVGVSPKKFGLAVDLKYSCRTLTVLCNFSVLENQKG